MSPRNRTGRGRCAGFVGLGWLPLIQAAEEIVKREGASVDQVKSKFGLLRYYTDLKDESEIWKLEEKSGEISPFPAGETWHEAANMIKVYQDGSFEITPFSPEDL